MLLLFFFLSFAHAYVENVTGGYLNCMSCHHSPSGGGLLNNYGRSLSQEMMSTFKVKNGEHPVFGLIKNTETLNWGGHVRTIQTRVENKNLKQGQQFLMQQNVELGVKLGSVWMIGTAGTKEGPRSTAERGSFLSERHYLLWEVAEDSRVRVGKFRQNFGLNDPNHTRPTKSALGFGSNTENYILEFNKFYESGEVSLSSSTGRIDEGFGTQAEKNISSSFQYYAGPKSKIGASVLVGESSTQRRSLIGVHGITTLTRKMYLKYELDLQRSQSSQTPTKDVDLAATFFSIGEIVSQGVNVYAFSEHLQRDLSQSSTQRVSPGIGIQWLPLAHVELQFEAKRTFNRSDKTNPSDSGFFMFHFYL